MVQPSWSRPGAPDATTPAGTPDLTAIPPAPRQPGPAARELIFGYQGAQQVLRIFGIVFLAVGVVVVPLNPNAPLDLALLVNSVPGSAEVTGVKATNTRVNKVTVREIHFRYTTGGATYEGSSCTTNRALTSLTPGSPVAIEMLPSHPSVSRVPGTTIGSMGYFSMMFLLFPAVGFGLMLSAWRSRRRRERAFTSGRPAVAMVTFSGPNTAVSINKRHPIQITWAFEVEGRKYTGSVSHMERSALAGLLGRDEIAVLYDPDEPSCNTAWLA